MTKQELEAELEKAREQVEAVRALVNSWRRGTATEYGSAVDQCRNAVLAALSSAVADTPEPVAARDDLAQAWALGYNAGFFDHENRSPHAIDSPNPYTSDVIHEGK